MKKFEWLDEYTLDSVSWSQAPARIRFCIDDKVISLTRVSAQDVYNHIGQFLQDTDRAPKA